MLTQKEIAEKVGCTQSWVCQKLKQKGISMVNSGYDESVLDLFKVEENSADHKSHTNKKFDLMTKRLENNVDYLSVNQIANKYGLTTNQVAKALVLNKAVCANEDSRIKGSPRYYDSKTIEAIFENKVAEVPEQKMFPKVTVEEETLNKVRDEVMGIKFFLDSGFVKQMEEYGISKQEIQRVKLEKVLKCVDSINSIIENYFDLLPF